MCRYCLGLDDIAGDFVSALSQKNPKLKAAALQLLQVQSLREAIVAEVLRMHAEAKLVASMPDTLPLMWKGLRSAGVCGGILQGVYCKVARRARPCSGGGGE